MAENYYSDEGQEEPAAEEQVAKDGDPTALLPTTFFPDGNPQPGKVCSVQVERVHDGQVEVKYMHDAAPVEESAPEGLEDEVPPPEGMGALMG